MSVIITAVVEQGKSWVEGITTKSDKESERMQHLFNWKLPCLVFIVLDGSSPLKVVFTVFQESTLLYLTFLTLYDLWPQ